MFAAATGPGAALTLVDVQDGAEAAHALSALECKTGHIQCSCSWSEWAMTWIADPPDELHLPGVLTGLLENQRQGSRWIN